MTDIHSGFENVDLASDIEALFSFLDAANALESIQSYRQTLLTLCPPKAGDNILDIGCGLGQGTVELASKVGPTVSIVGIDKSEALITEAQRRSAAMPLAPTFQVGEAQQLPFADNSFDMCRMERALMYIDSPGRVLDEMRRVLRPGGRVALFEFDYDCILVDSPHTNITRCLMDSVSSSIASPWIGRQLPRLLGERGFGSLAMRPYIIATPIEIFRNVVGGTIENSVRRGAHDSEAVEIWWRDLEQADREGHFFAGFLGFIICAQLPD
ncbi:MAG: methyltransferase domain-containing protein [Sphingorhabdus sp.]|uniref:methyltransferase domain-containing protein n=1 Tax=Sphingorhabdus sp. TaxID=1902408 RepID=UPI003CB341F6